MGLSSDNYLEKARMNARVQLECFFALYLVTSKVNDFKDADDYLSAYRYWEKVLSDWKIILKKLDGIDF